MYFYQVLESIMKERNLTVADVARICNVPDSTVRGAVIRKSKSIALSVAFKLSEGLGVSLQTLNGEDEKAGKDKDTYTKSEIEHINKLRSLDIHAKKIVNLVLNAELERIQQEAEKAHNITDFESVMFFDLPVSAGTGVFLDSENCEHVDFPADEVPQGTDFALRIHGDSMEPLYADGSTVFVRVQPSINEGEIGIFVLNGEGYIKRLEKKNGSTYLVSENPKYKPIKILDSDTLSCVGKVLN